MATDTPSLAELVRRRDQLSGRASAPVAQRPRLPATSRPLSQVSRRSGGEGGLLGNLKGAAGLVASLPSGMIGLGRSAASTVVGIPREAVETGLGAVGIGDGGEWGIERGRSLKDNVAGFTRATGPLVADIASGMKNTGERLVETGAALAPGGTPAGENPFSQAWREGQLASLLVEDVGNLGLAGAGVARGLRSAGRAAQAPRLVSAADRVAEVSRLGDSFGAAPAKAFTIPARAVNRGVERVAGRSLTELARIAAEAKAPAAFKPSVRAASRMLSERQFAEAVPQMDAANVLRRVEQLVPDRTDQVAVNLARSSESTVRNLVAAAERGADFGRLVGDAFPDQTPGYAVTPQAVARAAAFLDGQLDSETMSRWTEAARLLDEDTARSTAAAMEPDSGRLGGPLNPEQLGNDIRPSVVDAERARLERGLSGMERAAFQARNQAMAARRGADARAVATGPQRPMGAVGTTAVRQAGRADGRADLLEARAGRLERLAERRRQQIVDVPDVLRTPLTARMDAQVDRALRTVSRIADELDDDAVRDKLTSLGEQRGRVGHRFHGVADAIAILDGDPRLSAEQQARLDRAAKRFKSERAKLLDSTWDKTIEAAPARFRRSLIQSRRLAKGLVEEADKLDREVGRGAGDVLRKALEEIPTTVGQMVDQGVDPAYLHGGRISALVDSKGTAGGSGRTTLPKQRRLASERQASTDVTAFDFASQLSAEAREGAQAIRNITARQFQETYGKSADMLGAEPAMTGAALSRWAKEQGYEPVSFSGIFDTVADANVGRDTVFLPAPMVEAFRNYFEPKRGAFWEGLGAVNRGFKMVTLPFSIRWHIGNMVGGYVLAVTSGGMGPVEVLSQLRRVRRDMKAGTLRTPARITAAGVPVNDRLALYDPLGAKRGGRVKRAVTRSYALNEFVDNMYRSAMYYSKRGKGVSEEAATRAVLRAMGDYGRMTPFERRYVREVLPFYAWARTIGVSMATLPIYHPTRAAWTLHLGDVYSDDDLPEWMAGMVPVGDGAVNIGFLNPIGDITNSPLTSVEGFAASMSPGLKVPLAVLAGIDANRGFSPLSSPEFSSRARGTDLGVLDDQVIRNIGLLRNVRDLVTGTQPRYGTGQRVRGVEPSRTRINSLAGLIGLPWPEKVDLEAERRRNRRSSSNGS